MGASRLSNSSAIRRGGSDTSEVFLKLWFQIEFPFLRYSAKLSEKCWRNKHSEMSQTYSCRMLSSFLALIDLVRVKHLIIVYCKRHAIDLLTRFLPTIHKLLSLPIYHPASCGLHIVLATPSIQWQSFFASRHIVHVWFLLASFRCLPSTPCQLFEFNEEKTYTERFIHSFLCEQPFPRIFIFCDCKEAPRNLCVLHLHFNDRRPDLVFCRFYFSSRPLMAVRWCKENDMTSMNYFVADDQRKSTNMKCRIWMSQKDARITM